MEQFTNNREFQKSRMAQEEAGKIMKTLKNKMDDMLLENWRENVDFSSLSHQLPTEVKIDYNLSSLMKSEYVYDVDPDLIDESITPNNYLKIQKRRAETKLIKSTILYKVDKEIDLSSNEQKYLKKWHGNITNNDG